MAAVEYYNGVLCVNGGWLYGDGKVMSYSDYVNMTKKEKGKTKSGAKLLRRGCRSTTALIEFESLPQKYRQIFHELHGDPKKIVGRDWMLEDMEHDYDAVKFYREHPLPDGQHLPLDAQVEYAATASVLNVLHHTLNNRIALRRALGNSTMGLWPTLAAAVERLPKDRWPHLLPANHRRLKSDWYDPFFKKGDKQVLRDYEAIISDKFGRRNAEKVNECGQLWLVARWADQVKRMPSHKQLMAAYNVEAEAKGWKPIKDVKTIGNFLNREDIQSLWFAHRHGEQKARNRFEYKHRTILPSMRDSLWYSDGTKLNYKYLDIYINDKGQTVKQIKTTTVYEVMDSYSECLLGCAFGDVENYEVQFKAYKETFRFTMTKAFQITTDNQGGHKKLKEFFGRLAHLCIPTKPYNGPSKTIENVFGRFQMDYLKRDWFFTGQNVGAKKLP